MADAATSTKLAQDLEDTSGLALEWLRQVLALPIDTESGPLMRAQSSAAMTALNTQLRADALRLRAQREDKALETLMKMMREKEATMPPPGLSETKESCAPSSGLLGDGSDGSSVRCEAQERHGAMPVAGA